MGKTVLVVPDQHAHKDHHNDRADWLGKLVRSYRNMQSRVCGIVKAKVHLYGGLDLLDRETFYTWSLNDPSFNTRFEAWEKSGYNKKLSPSIDRIETSIGYVLGNIRWITHSENSRLGAISRFNK